MAEISLSSTNDHPSYHPLGPRLANLTPATVPSRITPLTGKHVLLLPTQLSHAASLFTHLGSTSNESLWACMGPWGPFDDLLTFTALLESWLSSTSIAALYSIALPSAPDAPLGLVGYVAFRDVARAVELGPVIYGAALQRTPAASEAVYLVLKRAFDECGCRRVAWECNARNAASRRAAERWGFQFEGIWRQSDVVKGRNRDTCWLSMLDGEWEEGVKGGFERWLGGLDENGNQRETLEDARKIALEEGKTNAGEN